ISVGPSRVAKPIRVNAYRLKVPVPEWAIVNALFFSTSLQLAVVRWRLLRLTRCWNVGRLPRCVAQPRIVGVRIQYDALPRILQIALLADLVHVLRYDFPCRADMLGEQFLRKVDHPH